jgi:hypothetical protein
MKWRVRVSHHEPQRSVMAGLVPAIHVVMTAQAGIQYSAASQVI